MYGPFWILWTLVVVLTIAGNLQRYLAMEDKKQFTYVFRFVPTAITVLFGVVTLVPLGIQFFVKLFGHRELEVPLIHGIGIYSYSLSSFLIASILCGFFTAGWVQWLLIVYSMCTSIMFISSVYWAELSMCLVSNKRSIIVGLVCAVQVTLLLIFKLYFF